MATVVEKYLYIGYDNAEEVCDAYGVELQVDSAVSGAGSAFRLYSKKSGTQYAQINANGLAQLFPSSTAHPFKADAGINRAFRFAGSTNSNNQGWVTINGTAYAALNLTTDRQDSIATDITTSNVTELTQATADLRVYWKHSSIAVAVGGDASFRLYFWQYTCAAQQAGNGIASVAVSDAAPYQGDSVTFTAELRPGAAWHGWYSDAACTQLVSTEQRYTVVAASDLTLYAKATAAVGTGLYVRTGGSYAEVQAVYRRVDGRYVEQTDIAGLLDTDVRYIRA